MMGKTKKKNQLKKAALCSAAVNSGATKVHPSVRVMNPIPAALSFGVEMQRNQELDHLTSIFTKVDSVIVSEVYEQSNFNYNSALEKLLEMTGEGDPDRSSVSFINRSHLSESRRLEQQKAHQDFLDSIDAINAASSSSSSSRGPHVPLPTATVPETTWYNSAKMSAVATPFVPKPPDPSRRMAKHRNEQIFIELDPELTKQLKLLKNPNSKILLLMRGLPGSGKTVLANHVAKQYDGQIVSADNFFSRTGYYCFEPDLLKYAHTDSQEKAEAWAKINASLIIVDNTNIESWEMIPYAEIAHRYGYRLVLAESKTAWRYTPATLAKRNRHKVSEDSINRSLQKFDHSITAERLMQQVRSKSNLSLGSCFDSKLQEKTLTKTPSATATATKAKKLGPRTDTPSTSSAVTTTPKSFNPVASFSLRDSSTLRDEVEILAMDTNESPDSDNEENGAEVLVEGLTVRERIRAGAEAFCEADSWSMPSFPGKSTIGRNVGQSVKVSVRNVGTQTVVEDFAKSELHSTGEFIPLVDHEDYRMEESDESSDSLPEQEYTCVRQPSSAIVKLDKGTNISNSQELGGLSAEEKIEILKQEFPDATHEHIVEVFKACHQDLGYIRLLLRGFDDEEDEFVITLSDSEDEDSDSKDEPEAVAVVNGAAADSRETRFTLNLDVELASALEAAFGKLPEKAYQNLQVPITDELAFHIYNSWAQETVEQSSPSRNSGLKNSAKEAKTDAAKGNNKKHTNGYLSAPRNAMEEIMQLEAARDQSLKDQLSSSQSEAIKLQAVLRKQLYNYFPGAPEESLDAILEANNYDVSKAQFEIRLSARQSGKSGLSGQVEYLNALKTNSRRMFPPSRDCKRGELRIPLNISLPPSIMALSLPGLRGEMTRLYAAKRTAEERARQCISNKLYMVSTHYREEANAMLRRIDQIAQAIVIKSLEVQGGGHALDLHFLYVREAMCVLKGFLKLKKEELKRSGKFKGSVVDVITGYGSGGTAPKIKPAVQRFLEASGYRYVPRNEGCFQVSLPNRRRYPTSS